MKYVTCKLPEGEGSASQMAIDWLYICEDSPKKGDTVHGPFGDYDCYMTVVGVSTRRAAISNYIGAVKSVRLVGPTERNLLAAETKAWDTAANYEAKASAASERVREFAERLSP